MADVPLMSNPMTTAGDLVVGGASGAPGRLGLGSALQHLRVNSGATALEFADPPSGSSGALFPLIGDPSSFAGDADTDFRGAADLGNYTAVGSDGAGTVALRTTTTSINIYELTDAGLLIQCGHGEGQTFRADYTLPDNQSIILAASGAPNLQAGDNANLALRLNDDNSGSTAGNYVSLMVEQDSTEYVVQGNSSADAGGFEYTLRSMHLPPLILFRIARDNLTYRSYVSLNGGATWNFVFAQTVAGALDNVWFGFSGASTGQTVMPTARVVFIVEGHGDDAYDPW